MGWSDPPPGRPSPWRTYCAVCAALVLVLVALLGPIYAFVLISCISTRTCNTGGLLHHVKAMCDTDDGLVIKETMEHGERCDLICNEVGTAPTSAALVCNDGSAQGAAGLRCLPIYVRDTRDSEGGLVSGAITDGDLVTVCPRAENLECEAVAGGTAMLVQLANLTSVHCIGLFEECRALNPIFGWVEYEENPPDPTTTIGPGGVTEPIIGTCTLGCYQPSASEEAIQGEKDVQAISNTPPPVLNSFQAGANVEAEPACAYGPMCIKVQDSCNDDSNGDFYRFPSCASTYPQWVQLNGSQRIRYDSEVASSQGGLWIMESDFVTPTASVKGTQLARQRSFDVQPTYGVAAWYTRCRTRINSFTYQIDYRTIDMNLSSCTCTSLEDCNGNGQAVGSKLEGPNCFCECFAGFRGTSCEERLCRAPNVLNANQPACQEGDWIPAGGTCTPNCLDTYVPSSDVFTCNAEGTQLYPPLFECRLPQAAGYNADDMVEFGLTSSTSRPECSNKDCAYRGTPTGSRYGNGSCVCECLPQFTGYMCTLTIGNCSAPLSDFIKNSMPSTCSEGQGISTFCTAQCEPPYYPLPARLECIENELVPAVFECFGGPTTLRYGCAVMQIVASVCSGLALCCLCIGLCWRTQGAGRITEAFFTKGKLVEVEEDKFGKFNVVRMEGGKPNRMPPRLVHPVKMLEEVLEPEPVRDEIDELYDALPPPPPPPVQDEVAVMLENEMASTIAGASEYSGPSFVDGQSPQALRDGHHTQALDQTGQTWSSAQLQISQTWMNPARTQEFLQGALASASSASAHGDARPRPPDVGKQNLDWLVQNHALEEQAQAARKQREAEIAHRAHSGAREATEEMERLLRETAVERAEIEEKMREAIRTGDAETLRSGLLRGRELLELIRKSPAHHRTTLTRCIQVAESRLDQYDERERARATKKNAQDRILRGEAPDWKMTTAEFWEHVRMANVGAVRAGLRAMQPLMGRTDDGQRNTLMHIAVENAVEDGKDEEATSRRLTVLEDLLRARAAPSMGNYERLTPLELVIQAAGDEAEASPLVAKLRGLGLRTTEEVAEELRKEEEAKARASRGSLGGPCLSRGSTIAR